MKDKRLLVMTTEEKLIKTLQIVSNSLYGYRVFENLKEQIDVAIAKAKDEIAKRGSE